jgi:trans-AT polyketide synthase/acyltransferase/oxidoreductase domain-containing protein
MITYVFPGQGSQSKGMGGILFDEFQELTAQADRMLGYSIRELCMDDPKMQLNRTQYTQPALFVVSALSYQKKVTETGKKPDYVAGHSLGEYNALFAAGAFDFETGLRLVAKRGELMSRATGGGMAAIIGITAEQVMAILKENGFDTIDIANLNSPAQIVISGRKEDIDKVKPVFEANQDVKMFAPLKVSGAFHSRYMSDARREFETILQPVEINSLTIPVISNLHARPYQQAELKQTLAGQIDHSVKWTETIRYLLGIGEMAFEEIGPGKVLTGLVQRIQKEAEPLNEAEEIPSKEEPKPMEKAAPAPAESASEKKQANTAAHPPFGKKMADTFKNIRDKAQDIMNPSAEAPEISSEPQESKKTEKAKPNPAKGTSKPAPGNYPAILAESLGSMDFRKDYNLRYNYVAGGMYHGISSPDMVVKMAEAGMMGFFGTGGLQLSEVETAIKYIQQKLNDSQSFGMNLLYNPMTPKLEEQLIDLFIRYKIHILEAASFLSITPYLIKYRAKGLEKDRQGNIASRNRIIAKVSRPEVAELFLGPAPEEMVVKMVSEGKISREEAEMLKAIPMADDLCVAGDSGGFTGQGIVSALMPAMIKLRDEAMKKYDYAKPIRVGCAGGIGTPEAAAAAFILGADFIVTGSVNQCTMEANTSQTVKDMLQRMNVQDTDYAPSEIMFEMGAKIQVLKKGLFFPARANKLYSLYRQYESLNDIDPKTKAEIEERYFKKSIQEVFNEIKSHNSPEEMDKAAQNPKYKMALVFKWYFHTAMQSALSGDEKYKIDYQIHCSPALGAFNQWVKGTPWETWQNRHAHEIGIKIMDEAAALLAQRFQSITV